MARSKSATRDAFYQRSSREACVSIMMPEHHMQELLAQRPWLERLARALADDRGQADDLVQDALVAGWQSRPDVDAPLRGWLAVVTRNAHRNRRRAEATRRRWEQAAMADEAEVVVPAPDVLHAQAEVKETLRKLVAALPPAHRDAVHALYFDERTSTEIEAQTGIPAATIRWRAKVALDLLRAELDRHYGDRGSWQAALVAVPAAMPAATGGVGAKTAGAAKGLFSMSFVMLALPTLVSLTAMFLPLRPVMRKALDGKERRQLMCLALLSGASIVQFSAAMAWAVPRGARGVQVATFLLLEAAMVALYGFWLPRIIRRRQADELMRDPGGAPRRHARERLWGRFGLALGTGIGAIGFLQNALRW